MPQPTLMDLLQKSAAFLTGKGLPNGRREAEWIFAETLALTRLELYTRFDMPVDETEVIRLRERITRRGKREPLAYVLGNQPFRDLKLVVTPAVLVPRPETEELIDLVLADLPATPCHLLDVGTGSGAIALALKRARPDCTVEATDISPEALAVARLNAEANGLDVRFHQGHLAKHLVTGDLAPFDRVVANLPYVGESERAVCDPELAHEPQVALFAGADGLDLIRELLTDAPRLWPTGGGALWLEHGWQQAAPIAAATTGLGLTSTVRQDGAGKDRFTRVAP